MTAPAITLTEHDYRARCTELDRRTAEKREEYDAAALARARGEGDPKLAYDLRSDLVTLELERQELAAAWRAAQRERELYKTEDGERRRREAYESSGQHIANGARLVAEIEALALRLGDLVEEAANEDQEVRRVVAPIVGANAMTPVPWRLVFYEHDLMTLLEGVHERYRGKRTADVGMTARAAAAAVSHQKRFARMLGQDFTNDNDEEAGS